MLRRNVETKIAVAFRTGATIVVVLAVVAILAQSLIYGGRTVTAANGPQLERGYNNTQLDERWFW